MTNNTTHRRNTGGHPLLRSIFQDAKIAITLKTEGEKYTK